MYYHSMSVLELARHIKQCIANTVNAIDAYKDSQFPLEECEVCVIKSALFLMERRVDKVIMLLEATISYYGGLGRKLAGELNGNQADILRHAVGCIGVSGALVDRLHNFNQFIKLVTESCCNKVGD